MNRKAASLRESFFGTFPLWAGGLVWASLVLVGCASVSDMDSMAASAAAQAQGNAASGMPTWHQDVRPQFEEHCLGCHFQGGVAPFALDSYESAKELAPLALAVIENGTMPPWMPDDSCRQYQDARQTPDELADLLQTWIEEDCPEGQAIDEVAGVESDNDVVLTEPDLILKPAFPFEPNDAGTDDYHCFLLDATFDEETFFRQVQIVPGNLETVHHVLLYLVLPESVASVEALDSQEEGEGYACFGSPGGGAAQTVGGWAPGAVSRPLDGDIAVRIPAGARLVMQVHYNVLATNGTDPGTEVHIWLDPEKPAYLLEAIPMAHLGLKIPARENHSVHTRTFYNDDGERWEVVAITPHMHLLGQSIRVTSNHLDEHHECLVDIPDWDFYWQQAYVFRPGESVLVEPGESITMECTYDNSVAHQPTVGNTKLEPRDVFWGEGTLDEMCLSYIAIKRAYYEVNGDGNVCQGFDSCYGECRATMDSMFACSLWCAVQSEGGVDVSDATCGQCLMKTLVMCLMPQCPESVGQGVMCVEDCNRASGDVKDCVLANCFEHITAIDACSQELVDGGFCDASIAGCGVSLQSSAP